MTPPCGGIQSNSRQIPLTIITGLLGSGKTTLLKKILMEKHGLKIAVLLNEYAPDDKFSQLEKPMFVGEKGNLYEEWMEVNNGCLCCTAKGKTEEALKHLSECSCIDCVIIECSGLANPGPIINTIWSDDLLNKKFKLNGVVTVVDARRIFTDNCDAEFDYEFKVQLSYADLVIINKMDLLATNVDFNQSQCRRLCQENVGRYNALATCAFTKFCDIDVVKCVLELKSYNDDDQTEFKLKAIQNNSKRSMHSSNVKNIRCLTIDLPSDSLFKRSRLNELLAELLWNNLDDKMSENKYGKIRRMKASVIVKERTKAVHRVIVQAVDDNYDEFEIVDENPEDHTSRFVFIGENMPEKIIRKTLIAHSSSC